MRGYRKGYRGAHILFVEDDEDQLLTTPRLLKVMGYEVTAERDPERASRIVAGHPGLFDLIITDYDMPGMSGTEFARLVAVAWRPSCLWCLFPAVKMRPWPLRACPISVRSLSSPTTRTI